MMKLVSFRVQDFRSVVDSGWIDTDAVTALIGTNESGKTNLLVALWKLNPAKEGEINLLADVPRKRYHEMRDLDPKPIFVSARFTMEDELAKRVATLTNLPTDDVREVVVHRDFSGDYSIEFPKASPVCWLDAAKVTAMLAAAAEDISGMTASKTEEPVKSEMIAKLRDASILISADQVGEEALNQLRRALGSVDTSKTTKHSVIAPRFAQVNRPGVVGDLVT